MSEPGQGEQADIGLYFERAGLPSLRLSERERERESTLGIGMYKIVL